MFLKLFSPFKQPGTVKPAGYSPGMAALLQGPENGAAGPSWVPRRKLTRVSNKQCKFPKVFENSKLKYTGCPEHVLAGGGSGGERLTLRDEQCVTGAVLL